MPKPVVKFYGKAEESYGCGETFGMLYRADIRSFEKELHNEIGQIFIRTGCRKNGRLWKSRAAS